MKRLLLLFAPMLVVLASTLTCCTHSGGGVPDAARSAYYWRTTLRFDSTERAWLRAHDVKRLYVRFFDVVQRSEGPMPNATLRFDDSVPAGIEVVPVVFIMENCLGEDLDARAEQLVERVWQMCETNDLASPRELQVDCDWTARSQEKYYGFLRRVRAAAQSRGMRLSATIRLHQLTMTPPPVDYGVLMVYNTGDMRRAGSNRNPILDYRDVEPYLRHLSGYALPLCAAYPTYDWQLLYDNQGFKALLHREELGDSTVFYPLPSGREWLVVAQRDLPMLSDDESLITWLAVGDTVRLWHVAASEVRRVSEALQQRRPTINDQVVIYSLDTRNINQYTHDDYETFYHH